ncbi:MAG: DUF2752 domain-containing protein [Streptosporangiales bacterium]|nr:DUF2752 domain-containing protein [Streptosporangiales bacterium]
MSADTGESSPPRPPVPVRVAWESIDRHRGLTLLAIGGLVVGGLMAVLGLPPIDMHGPLHRWFGIMDPLCGGTRGVSYAIRGDWRLAWAYNPASIPLVVGAVVLVVRRLVGMVSGRWLNVWFLLPRRVAIPLFGVLLVALEINQQLHAPLLMGP